MIVGRKEEIEFTKPNDTFLLMPEPIYFFYRRLSQNFTLFMYPDLLVNQFFFVHLPMYKQA